MPGAPPVPTNAADPPSPPLSTGGDAAASVTRLGFDDGLDGWTVTQSGGSLDGLGTVTCGSAVLREGDSFLVTLDREIIIPDDPVAIEFIYIASFDTTDPDSIKDAFEVALIDGDGYSLVDTFTAQRDAYFNLTEDLPAALGAGVAHTAVSQDHQVTLDISNVPPGTEATLTFRLVNNDTDTETTVTILSVDITVRATDYYLDVDGNGLVTPADVLIVINHLNATRPPAASSAEGEAASLQPQTANVPSGPSMPVPGTVMNPQTVRGNYPYSHTVAMLAAEGESGSNHPVQSPERTPPQSGWRDPDLSLHLDRQQR